ncbi:hypothetical protein [Treponema endosymbiont of Eucomonympha sp.]|nr:hypothetical protein [Treponema endosymbiont of Eucomonympha sp.]
MTAYRRGVTEKSLYYIEIHGVKARPDARLAGFFAPLARFYERLAGPCE